MSAPDPRRLAFAVIERVAGGAFCDVLVGETLERSRLPAREAALFTRLVYGTITWQGRLDWTLAALSRRPIERLDPAVRTALRLGLFQLFRLDRVPPHAAVHTSVELAKRAAGAGAGGFVNGILRAAIRAGERSLPRTEDDPVRALAVRWSHPEWLVERWLAELGRERTEALLAADDEPAPTVLRIDRRVRSREQAIAELADRGVAARAAEFAATAVVVERGARAALDVPWAAPQGEASQLVAAMVGAAAGERIADVCAAPGGKAAALAEALGAAGGGLVVASDRAGAGMRRVRAIAERPPGRPIAALRADAAMPALARGAFDAVLLDAPCSGLGTLRAHPEIRWRRTPERVRELAGVQRRLLAASAALVRPGGRLVYATCTLLREENDDVVDAFLAVRDGWRRDDPRPLLGAAAGLVDAGGALRTSPDRGGLDGFYAVRLLRSPG